VSLHSVDNVFTRCSPQSLLVGVLDCRKRAVLNMLVTGDSGSVVWALVVVLTKRRLVEAVDDICALEILLPKMRSTVSKFFFFTDLVKRPVGPVARIALFQ
jgi:hypothetical protein